MPCSTPSPWVHATERSLSGAAIIDLLNNVFETLNATLRARGGEVLKFLGDGMLATLSFRRQLAWRFAGARSMLLRVPVQHVAALNATSRGCRFSSCNGGYRVAHWGGAVW